MAGTRWAATVRPAATTVAVRDLATRAGPTRAPSSPGGSRPRVRESVSDAKHRQQVPGIVRVGFDLPPQVLDVRVDRALVRLKSDASNRAEKLRAAEDTAWLARHRGQQLELGRGEVDAPPGDGKLQARQVGRAI